MTMDSPSMFPDLEPRFLQPAGWRWHSFKNASGRKLRFGTISPKSRVPDAVVVCLPGLSEFAEKYFELAQDFTDRNLSFWILDWEGQGKSDRLLSNPHKRHSDGFDSDVADLHMFVSEYVRTASVYPDVGRIPMVMLGHSMGGNIGLRYLLKHPGTFSCAAFSAPMGGIAAVESLPLPLAVAISGILKTIAGQSYVYGGHDWSPAERDDPARNIFSHDPIRSQIQNAWCNADPALQVGNVTYGWVHSALSSCLTLQTELETQSLSTPCLFSLAGQEKLVSNTQNHKLISLLPDATIVDLPDSFHEILMERDDIRSVFIERFMTFLEDKCMRQKLKRF